MAHSSIRSATFTSCARWASALLLTGVAIGCDPGATDDGESSAATGGAATGGVATGGVATGGVGTGGTATGGAASGGTATGGFASGGAPGVGGLASGGTSTGGAGTGGDVSGGAGGTLGTGGQGTGGLGTGGEGTGGTGGGGLAFDPCPASEPCKVLPLGDSITEGWVPNTNPTQFNGGYRVKLFELAVTDDKNITFVGTRSNGPNMVADQTFPKNNEGYSGIKIQALNDQHVPSKLAGAHIVLLHIGTNDMTSPANAQAHLEALIDEITDALPDSLLVVSNIIPFPPAGAATTAYNAAIPGIVEEKAAAGAHVIFVDQNTVFPTNQLPDSVHPSAAGYAVMGGVWYDAIKSYLH